MNTWHLLCMSELLPLKVAKKKLINPNFFDFNCRHSYGEQFSKKKWLKEMVGQRELLSAFAGIPLEDIRGMRAPFLAVRRRDGPNHLRISLEIAVLELRN